MEKIKVGFLIISFRKNIEILVDENTGNKYLMTGHDFYENDNYCSGLTLMLDENGIKFSIKHFFNRLICS